MPSLGYLTILPSTHRLEVRHLLGETWLYVGYWIEGLGALHRRRLIDERISLLFCRSTAFATASQT